MRFITAILIIFSTFIVEIYGQGMDLTFCDQSTIGNN